MAKAIKFIITAVILLALAGAVTVCVLIWVGRDYSDIDRTYNETKTIQIEDVFNSISIDINTADIVFIPSENGKCSLKIYENEREKHSASVTGGTLEIVSEKSGKWRAIDRTPNISVYLPKNEYNALNIKNDTGDTEIPGGISFKNIDISSKTGDFVCSAPSSESIAIKSDTGDINLINSSADNFVISASTGDISIESISCSGNIEISSDTGEKDISDCTCKNLIISSNTGDVSLKNVISKEKLSVTTGAGDVKLEKSDAVNIIIETDTGDIRGTVISAKIFNAHSDTGRVNVPYSAAGYGTCDITSDTGEIDISLAS